MLEAFIEEQVNKICKRYKISTENAKSVLLSRLQGNLELSELIENADSLKSIYKTRLYKDFSKKTKKEIYFDLRTYQKESSNLVTSHISTKERVKEFDSFISQIDEFLTNAETIVDLGGGMFPAAFPFKRYPKIKTFTWLDKDEISYNKLKNFGGPESLLLLHEKIGDRSWNNILHGNYVDFAFMLKLIPVVKRQEQHLVEYLAQIPANTILVTGSKEAMVRKENIEMREEKILQEFITMTGKTILKRIDIENEFGYIIS